MSRRCVTVSIRIFILGKGKLCDSTNKGIIRRIVTVATFYYKNPFVGGQKSQFDFENQQKTTTKAKMNTKILILVRFLRKDFLCIIWTIFEKI